MTGRLAGAFLFLWALTGGLAYGYSQGMLVGGDAAATAANILASETRFRLAIAGNLLSQACFIASTVVLYDVFTPVSRAAARTVVFFNLTACAIGVFNSLFQLGALEVLQRPPYLSAYSTPQLQALAALLLKLNIQALDMGQIFFGFQWIAVGYLILRSVFIPRILGALVAFSGAWYLTRLYPPLVEALMPYSISMPAVGLLAFTLWLLVRGVNAQRWQEQFAARFE
ncbi:MAG: DUF4386 domain-containing protein [Gemmatimonadota bacterium]